MKFRWKDFVTFNADGGGADGGGAPGTGAGAGAPAGTLADAAARIVATQGDGQQSGNGQPPANGQQQSNAPQQNGQQQNGQQSQAYYPDGLPDGFRGTNDRETIDKLFGDINGRPKPPASPKDYKYEFGKEFTEKFGDLKDDPVLPMWSEIAHELGLGNKQAQDVVPKFYDKLAEAGLIAKPVDVNEELAKLEPNEPDLVRRTAKGAQRVNAIATTLKGLEARGVLTKADNLRLGIMMMDAANVTAFEKVLKLLPAEHGLQNGGAPTDGRTPYQKQLDAFYPSMSKTN